ncbi:MAG: type II secretion system protein [Nibricoccus sp.]
MNHSIPKAWAGRNQNGRAFTLVEVMVSTLIFAMSAMTLSSLYLQNMRFAKQQTYNVQLINTSFGILDQIKNAGAEQIWQAYLAPGTSKLNVNYVDPADTTDGYRVLQLAINKTDDTEVSTTWTSVDLKFGTDHGFTTIPIKYWITIRRNLMKTGQKINCDVLELTLVYQWQIRGKTNKYVGQLQLTFPAPNGTFKE